MSDALQSSLNKINIEHGTITRIFNFLFFCEKNPVRYAVLKECIKDLYLFWYQSLKEIGAKIEYLEK